MEIRPPVTENDLAEIIAGCRAVDQFKDVLNFLWNTGCKRQHILLMEASHFDEPNKLMRFYGDTIHLNDEALQIMQRLCSRYPKGKIFRNNRHRAWTYLAFSSRFKSISKRIGKKITSHDLRRGFATKKLKEGHEPIFVASLLNQVDAKRIMAERAKTIL